VADVPSDDFDEGVVLFFHDEAVPPCSKSSGETDIAESHKQGRLLAIPRLYEPRLRVFVDETPPDYLLEAVTTANDKHLLHVSSGRVVATEIAPKINSEVVPSGMRFNLPGGDYFVSVLKLDWKPEVLNQEMERVLGKKNYREYMRLQKKQSIGCALTAGFGALFIFYNMLPRTWQQSASGIVGMIFVELAIMWAVIIFLSGTSGARKRAELLSKFYDSHPDLLLVCVRANDSGESSTHVNAVPAELQHFV
jgi:hypothetical protein